MNLLRVPSWLFVQGLYFLHEVLEEGTKLHEEKLLMTHGSFVLFLIPIIAGSPYASQNILLTELCYLMPLWLFSKQLTLPSRYLG